MLTNKNHIVLSCSKKCEKSPYKLRKLVKTKDELVLFPARNLTGTFGLIKISKSQWKNHSKGRRGQDLKEKV